MPWWCPLGSGGGTKFGVVHNRDAALALVDAIDGRVAESQNRSRPEVEAFYLPPGLLMC